MHSNNQARLLTVQRKVQTFRKATRLMPWDSATPVASRQQLKSTSMVDHVNWLSANPTWPLKTPTNVGACHTVVCLNQAGIPNASNLSAADLPKRNDPLHSKAISVPSTTTLILSMWSKSLLISVLLCGSAWARLPTPPNQDRKMTIPSMFIVHSGRMLNSPLQIMNRNPWRGKPARSSAKRWTRIGVPISLTLAKEKWK